MTIEHCEACGQVTDDLLAGACADCHSYQQEQEQEQEQDIEPQREVGRPLLLPSTSPASHKPVRLPDPVGNSEPTWLDIALDEHEAGRLRPVDVQLGPMPARAGSVMREIAEDMRFLIGLRLALGELRPLPYATTLAVKRTRAPDPGTASKAISSLERFGVIRCVGAMKPQRSGIDGTKLYAPPAVAKVVDIADRRTA